MPTIVTVILVAGAICGLGALLFSTSSDPKDRIKEAGVFGAIGSFYVGGCLLSAAFEVAILLLGIWVLVKIFG